MNIENCMTNRVSHRHSKNLEYEKKTKQLLENLVLSFLDETLHELIF